MTALNRIWTVSAETRSEKVDGAVVAEDPIKCACCGKDTTKVVRLNTGDSVGPECGPALERISRAVLHIEDGARRISEARFLRGSKKQIDWLQSRGAI